MPSWSDIVNQFVTAWQMIRDAPVPSISALVVAVLLIWGAFSWRYSGQLENKDGIIAARDATIKYQESQLIEYRSKLKVASPDEAAKQNEDLRAQVSQMQGQISAMEKRQSTQVSRQISTTQRDKFIDSAMHYRGIMPHIKVEYDGSCADRNGYSRDFVSMINAVQGWSASGGHFVIGFGIGFADSKGITVTTPRDARDSPAVRAFTASLSAAEFKFNILPWGADGSDPEMTLSILQYRD